MFTANAASIPTPTCRPSLKAAQDLRSARTLREAPLPATKPRRFSFFQLHANNAFENSTPAPTAAGPGPGPPPPPPPRPPMGVRTPSGPTSLLSTAQPSPPRSERGSSTPPPPSNLHTRCRPPRSVPFRPRFVPARPRLARFPPHPNHRNPSPQRRNSNRGPAPRTLHSPANGYRREAAYGRAGAGAAGLARSVCLRRTKEPGQPQCPPRRAAHAPRPAPTAVHYGRCSPPPLDTGVAAGHRGRCRPSLTSARTTAPNMHRAGRKRKCSSRYKAAAPPCGLKGPRPA